MTVPVEPGWLSLLPPLLAILLALVFREVLLSLFAGVWLGALLLNGWDPFAASLRTIDQYILNTVASNADHVAILIFSLLLGGMVGVMSRSGGTHGIVEAMRPLATSARRGQFFTWLAGLFIFFDDYANTLVVGNTMRPVTDRLHVSREKLAYIVDSTAAPVAVLAVISTWVGFEISLIGDTLGGVAAQATDAAVGEQLLRASQNPFNVFLHSIPYLFYPIFAVIFVALTVLTRRDFGPMLAAERRARATGEVLRPGATPAAEVTGGLMEPPAGVQRRWINAALPVLAVIVAALIGIYTTGRAAAGEGASLREIVGGANPFRTLLWAAATGCFVAIVLAVAGRVLTLGQTIEAWVGGMRAIFLAIIILVLAWALGDITKDLGTGAYLSRVIGEALPLAVLPALVFLVAAVISFATGTSWGTMTILFPVVLPLAVGLGAGAGFEAGSGYTILLGVVSSIMAGSIFGDHCSPISDTTIMSSMASACDHIDHVRTQLPYAIVVALIAMTVGDIPTALGVSPWLALPVGVVVMFIVLRVFGRSTDAAETGAAPYRAQSPLASTAR
jgi:Na+/H+ antiporter NhaC